MKKYCIITSSYPRTKDDSINAGVFVRDFAWEIQQRNNEVFVITPDKKGEKEKNPKITVEYFPTIGGETELTSLNPKNPIDLFKLFYLILSGCFFSIAKLIKKKPQEIIAFWAVPSGLFAWISFIFLKIPFSVWVLGSDIWDIKKYPLGEFFLKRILKNSRVNFADGYSLSSKVENITDRTCYYLPSIRGLDKTIKRLDVRLDKKKKHFIFIGRFHQSKGIDFLIDSIFELPNDIKSSIHFHIFGDGPMKDLVYRKYYDHHLQNIVSLYGYADVNAVVSYLELCDCIIIPSRIESIPLILSEAIQMECPIIATDVGDMRMIIERYNIGEIVPPLDTNAMVCAISSMFYRNRSDFSIDFKKAKTFFSVKNMIDTFMQY